MIMPGEFAIPPRLEIRCGWRRIPARFRRSAYTGNESVFGGVSHV
jgi:hypothetical protein